MKKEIEKATITRLNDNTYADKNDHIVSVSLDLDGGSIIGTPGYRKNSYTNFITNLMTILGISDKSQIEGKQLLACTDYYTLLALGNELGTQWIVMKDVSKIISGDIIQYLERQEDIER